MGDLIVADIQELNDYIQKAERITDRLDDETRQILVKFKNIPDWDDEIREKVAYVLEEIERSQINICDYFHEVNKQVKALSDDLDDYLNSSHGY